jgi:hypothetical protein
MKVTFYKNGTTPWAMWETHHEVLGFDYSYSYAFAGGEWLNHNGAAGAEGHKWVRKAYNIYLAEIIVGSRPEESRAVIQL